MSSVKEVETFEMLNDNVVLGTEELGDFVFCVCLKMVLFLGQKLIYQDDTS